MADSWDIEPDEDPSNQAYHGRRRAEGAPARRWVVLTLVLLALGSVVAIALAMMNSPDSDDLATPPGLRSAGSGADGGGSQSAASSSSAGPTGQSSARTQPVAPGPPFNPMTIEGEAGVRGGSAVSVAAEGASHGQVVVMIGLWDPSVGEGTLRFDNVTVPNAGTYTITVYYTFIPSDDRKRTAVITVNGAAPIIEKVSGQAPCCARSFGINIALKQGANTIKFGNGDGHAPSIDRIVISRP